MNNWLKLGIAYLLAPSLLIGAACAFAMVFSVTLIATVLVVAAVMLAVPAILTLRRLGVSYRQWKINRFSPVRRKHPRPTAWHQWK